MSSHSSPKFHENVKTHSTFQNEFYLPTRWIKTRIQNEQKVHVCSHSAKKKQEWAHNENDGSSKQREKSAANFHELLLLLRFFLAANKNPPLFLNHNLCTAHIPMLLSLLQLFFALLSVRALWNVFVIFFLGRLLICTERKRERESEKARATYHFNVHMVYALRQMHLQCCDKC